MIKSLCVQQFALLVGTPEGNLWVRLGHSSVRTIVNKMVWHTQWLKGLSLDEAWSLDIFLYYDKRKHRET